MQSHNNNMFTRRSLLKGAALAGAALLLHTPARLLAAVSAAEELHTQSRVMLGTFVNISVKSSSLTRAEEAMGRAFEEVCRLEALLSRHQSSSPLSVLNAQGSLLDAPIELTALLDRAKRVHSLSQGAFDITVAPVLELFRAKQNPQGRMRIDAAELAEARELIDAKAVHMAPDHVRLGKQGMILTLDGIAKGYIADRASQILVDHGITNHLVNAGGDIRAMGSKDEGQPWQVGVEHPTHKGKVATSLSLQKAIATSGSYEIYFDAEGERHHLIDPRLKDSPRHTLSVSVTAPSAMEADALATALSVMPVGDALRLTHSLPGRECCLLTRDGRMATSQGWGKA